MNTSDVIAAYLAARRAQGVQLRSGARSLRQFARETGDGPLHEVTPQAVATFLRGQLIYDNARGVVGKPIGQYLHRPTA